MSRTPIDLELGDELTEFPEQMGLGEDFLKLLKQCPDCGMVVIVADNEVWLDGKPQKPQEVDAASMGVVRIGSMCVAAGGALTGGTRHRIHAHQPG